VSSSSWNAVTGPWKTPTHLNLYHPYVTRNLSSWPSTSNHPPGTLLHCLSPPGLVWEVVVAFHAMCQQGHCIPDQESVWHLRLLRSLISGPRFDSLCTGGNFCVIQSLAGLGLVTSIEERERKGAQSLRGPKPSSLEE
jgi:hypothetical protein